MGDTCRALSDLISSELQWLTASSILSIAEGMRQLLVTSSEEWSEYYQMKSLSWCSPGQIAPSIHLLEVICTSERKRNMLICNSICIHVYTKKQKIYRFALYSVFQKKKENLIFWATVTCILRMKYDWNKTWALLY